MRYFIKPLKNKKSDPKWKVQLISYKKEDILSRRGKDHKSDKVTSDVKRKEWYHHGFSEEMTYEQAKERAKQLNAQAKLDDQQKNELPYKSDLKKRSSKSQHFYPLSW